MTIETKYLQLDSLQPGQFIFHNLKDVNEWQAAVNRLKSKKQFEISGDKVIRVVNA